MQRITNLLNIKGPRCDHALAVTRNEADQLTVGCIRCQYALDHADLVDILRAPTAEVGQTTVGEFVDDIKRRAGEKAN